MNKYEIELLNSASNGKWEWMNGRSHTRVSIQTQKYYHACKVNRFKNNTNKYKF